MQPGSFFQIITLLFYFPAFLSGVSPMRMLYIEDIAPYVQQLACVQVLNSSMSSAVLVIWNSPKMWLLREKKMTTLDVRSQAEQPRYIKT